MKAGLLGGKGLAKYTVAPLVWGELLRGKRVSFSLFEAGSEEEVEELLSSKGFLGINVAKPWKQLVCRLAKERSSACRKTGCANAYRFSDGKADNFDGKALVEAIEDASGSVSGKKVVLVGCGGAARSTALELLEKNAVVTAFDVSAGALESFSKLFKRDYGETTSPMSGLEGAVKGCDILINATPLGMRVEGGGNELKTPVNERALGRMREGGVVAEMNYSPEKTLLLRIAEENGLRAVPGKHMLVKQAIMSYEFFIGEKPPEGRVRAAYESLGKALG